jgi:hypothetical protein
MSIHSSYHSWSAGTAECTVGLHHVNVRAAQKSGASQIAFIGHFCKTRALYSPVLGRCFDGHFRFHHANRALTLP